MKKFLLLILAVIYVGLPVFAGGQKEKDDTVSVGLVLSTLNNPFLRCSERRSGVEGPGAGIFPGCP